MSNNQNNSKSCRHHFEGFGVFKLKLLTNKTFSNEIKGKCLTQEQKLQDQLQAHNIEEKDLMKMTEEEIRARFRDARSIIKIKKAAVENTHNDALSRFPRCPKCKILIDKISGFI